MIQIFLEPLLRFLVVDTELVSELRLKVELLKCDAGRLLGPEVHRGRTLRDYGAARDLNRLHLDQEDLSVLVANRLQLLLGDLFNI